MTVTPGTPFTINASGDTPHGNGLLDANNAVVLYRISTSYKANVVQDDETVGADYTFAGTANTGIHGLAVDGLSSTSAISLRSRQATGAVAQVLSRSGTTLSTPGSEVDLGATDPQGLACVALSSTAAIAVYADDNESNRGTANYLTISGTTITDESLVVFEAGATNDTTALCKLTTTKAVVVFRDTSDSNQLKAVVLSISGVTISAGAAATIDAGDSCEDPALASISSTSCLLTYRNVTDADLKMVVLSGMSGTTVTVNTPVIIDSADARLPGVAAFSATEFICCYGRISDGDGRLQELAVSGVVPSTVGANTSFAAGGSNNNLVAFSATLAFNSYSASTDGVLLTLGDVNSHIWLSTDAAATFTNIGDATWAANVVGGVVVVPGTAYQTIFSVVGTSLYKTTNGGTAWTLETAVGYEADFIDLEKDNTTVFLAKRDAAGTNRASLWDSVGASLTHINTGKSTTGGATSGGDVV